MSKTYKTADIDAMELDADINENTTKRTTWFSIPSELLNDPNFESRIEDFSPHYFLFYCYLKTRMLGNEKYYIFEKDIKRTIKMYCAAYDAEENVVREIYDSLLMTGEIKILHPVCFNGNAIVTDDAIIENYYQAQKKRAYERNKARNKTDKENEEKGQAPTAPIAPPPAPTAPINTDSVEVISADAEKELVHTEGEVFGEDILDASNLFM